MQILEALGFEPGGLTTHTNALSTDELAGILNFVMKNVAPGSSDVIAMKDFSQANSRMFEHLREGNYGSAGNEGIISILSGLGALPLIPNLAGMLRQTGDPGKGIAYLKDLFRLQSKEGASPIEAIEELQPAYGNMYYIPPMGGPGYETLLRNPVGRVAEELPGPTGIDLDKFRDIALSGERLTAASPQELIEWPELYKSNPGLAAMPTYFNNAHPGEATGMFELPRGTIQASTGRVYPGSIEINPSTTSPESSALATMHEMGHVMAQGSPYGNMGIKPYEGMNLRATNTLPRGTADAGAISDMLYSYVKMSRLKERAGADYSVDIDSTMKNLDQTFKQIFGSSIPDYVKMLGRESEANRVVNLPSSERAYASSLGENMVESQAKADFNQWLTGDRENIDPFSRAIEEYLNRGLPDKTVPWE